MVNYDFGDGSNVFFTSDTHFWHDNIRHMTDRPFKTVEEMNNKIIENWNKVVGKDDIVFHLGDFAFGGPQKWINILEQLNGHIYLIMGNHDFKNLKDNVKQYFVSVQQQMRIQIDGWTLYLNHYPYLCFGGAWSPERLVAQAFGHVHYCDNCKGLDRNRMDYLFPSQYDVGTDNNNFTPISWKQFRKIVEKNMYEGKNMAGINIVNNDSKRIY